MLLNRIVFTSGYVINPHFSWGAPCSRAMQYTTHTHTHTHIPTKITHIPYLMEMWDVTGFNNALIEEILRHMAPWD